MSLQVTHPGGSMLKLAMLGDGGVGKTALVVQSFLNKFVETYDPTIEDTYRKRIYSGNEAMTLELMDTAGQAEYVSLRDQWIRDGEGFSLVYSVTQRLSFTRIKQYYSEIKRIKDDVPFAVVLVGNKVDQTMERVVSTKEGEDLAKSWGIEFLETSAKSNINAEKAFVTLAQATRDKHLNKEAENNRAYPSSLDQSQDFMNDRHQHQTADSALPQPDQNFLYPSNTSLSPSKKLSPSHEKGASIGESSQIQTHLHPSDSVHRSHYESAEIQTSPQSHQQHTQRSRQPSHISTNTSGSRNSFAPSRKSSSSSRRNSSARVERLGSQKKKSKCSVM